MKLSKKDTEAFVNAVIKASEPNENLIAAAKEYKKIIGEHRLYLPMQAIAKII